jgi:hypothetical protein
MIDFLSNNIAWILVVVYLICIVGVVFVFSKIFEHKSVPWDCFLAAVFILVTIPFKYILEAICVWWLYIRLKEFNTECQVKKQIN